MEYAELESPESGKRWRLRYSNRAFRWLESKTGESFQALIERFGDNRWTLEEITWMVAAALYDENREITIDDADDVIDECGFEPVIEVVAKAIEQSSFAKNRSDPQPGTAGAASKNGGGTGTKRKAKQRG